MVNPTAGAAQPDEEAANPMDPVDEASLQSFPASDPPPWWAGSAASQVAVEGSPPE